MLCILMYGAGPARCPSGEIGRHKGLESNLSPSGETWEVTPVKFGESPGCACTLARPSQRRAKPHACRAGGRCREQTAGTYGRKARVKACSRPRTAAYAAAGGESRSGKKIPRLRGRAGSIPASGTIGFYLSAQRRRIRCSARVCRCGVFAGAVRKALERGQAERGYRLMPCRGDALRGFDLFDWSRCLSTRSRPAGRPPLDMRKCPGCGGL